MREAAQMVSYEVPMALAILVPIIVTGSMNLSTVVTGIPVPTASGTTTVGGQNWIWEWNLFHDPFTFCAFWLYFTAATASCKRAPFDLAEAESELVAGFHTEYSGFRWLSIFMAEYGSMFAVSGIATIMFLGGWRLGFYPELTGLLGDTLGLGLVGMVIGNVINVIVFIAKCWFLVFIMMWVRWTLPRLRIDQVMMTCLKYLLPLSCFLLLGVSLWQVLVPFLVQDVIRWVLFAACMLMILWTIRQWVRWSSAPPSSAMPGMWRTAGLPGYQGAKQG
jgi:NADH-quinone oxidoreductase subunit H